MPTSTLRNKPDIPAGPGAPPAAAAIVSLGCAKNLVDSEVIGAQLVDLGFRLTDDPAEASLVVVNTCGFLQSAVEEGIDTILELAAGSSSVPGRDLIVTGCMVQRYGRKLVAELPEVALFLGTSHVHHLAEAYRRYREGDPTRLRIGPPRSQVSHSTPRVRSTPFYMAYVRIAEGCDNRCTYCMIPRLRGPLRSRPADDVEREVRRLAGEGVVEVNLIAQDTTAYGLDRGEPGALQTLLRRLDTVDPIRWLRLLYSHPARITDELLDTIARSDKIVPYLDVPLQHSQSRVLAAMHRGVPGFDPLRMVERIRIRVPGAALRTTLLVGFPGETETDFVRLERFVEEARFDHLGVFVFSAEPGTAAARLPAQIPKEEAERRRERLLDLQREISRARLGRYIDRTVPVLIEGPHPETDLLLAGRMATQAPEVDGMVMITAGNANAGEIVDVRITRSHDYDLEGTVLTDINTVPSHSAPPRSS